MNRILKNALLMVFAFAHASFGNDIELPKKWVRIQVRVSAPDPIRSEIASYINRELRALGDVEITDHEPGHIVEVVALDMQARSGVPTGYAISATVSQPVSLTLAKAAYEKVREVANSPYFTADFFKIIEVSAAGAVTLRGHYLRTGGPQDLQAICRELTATIDSKVLELFRQSTQQTLRDVRKSIEQQKRATSK